MDNGLDGEESEEEAVEIYKEPSMYDSLLMTLGSASESLASAYKKRYINRFCLIVDIVFSYRITQGGFY